ncbi:hypothetical protein D3C76_553490 [compost metagenome]
MPDAFGAVWMMPASGLASIRRTRLVRHSPLITLSASSTTMYLYWLPQRRQKSSMLPLLRFTRRRRRR